MTAQDEQQPLTGQPIADRLEPSQAAALKAIITQVDTDNI
jgi:hypothetical protein